MKANTANMSADPSSSDLTLDAVATTSAETTTQEWLVTAVQAMGGAERIGQKAMATQVARALETRQHLLVQAGTGTGKSLAYLIPALHHAQNADKPVIISTATLALQSQIMRRDAPNVLSALKDVLPHSMDVALLKGRANYVCRNKLDGGMQGDDLAEPLLDIDPMGAKAGFTGISDLGQQVMRLRSWAETTETGDRDELTPGVTDTAWRQVSVTARECIGASKCPMAEECFSELARKKASEADIVVTNHAMLAISAFEEIQVLPEFDAVIIDEAHEFSDRVTSAVTTQLSGSMVRSIATSARKEAAISTTELTSAADALDAAFVASPDGWFSQGFNAAQISALELVRDSARNGLSDLKSSSDNKNNDDGADSGTHLLRTRLQEVLEVVERMLSAHDSNGQTIVWATRPGHFEPGVGYVPGDPSSPPILYSAPLSVAFKLQENLLNEATTIFTSATLALGGKFDAVAQGLGFLGPKAPRYKAIDVGSPFDYRTQGILYTARDLPKPGREASPQMLDRLEELLKASRGGALCLFSSKRAATEAADGMRQRLGEELPILAQGDASLASLIEEFADDHHTSLFGTLSLWQGVDVPGEALRLVTIDRIPFPRPDDPLSTARARHIQKSGGNGFMAVSATHAAVRLAQGVGRLIRSTSDRGVVAILDSRIATAGYGGFLRASLPNFWSTSDPEKVLGSLKRISASSN